MNSKTLIDKLCAYYKQNKLDEIRTEDGQIGNVPNIQVLEAWKWIEDNLDSSNFDRFYEMIKKTFYPTATVPFPLVSNFEDIKNNYICDRSEYIQAQLTFEQAQEKFAEENKINMESPEETKNATLQEIFADDIILTASELIKKYGIKKCGECWEKQSLYMTDEEWEKYRLSGYNKRLQNDIFRQKEKTKKYFKPIENPAYFQE